MTRIGSIPPNIRNNLKRTSGFSIGSCQQQTEQNTNYIIRKGTKNIQKKKERISIQGFNEKLTWLNEHLAELKELNTPAKIIEEVLSQIERIEEVRAELAKRR